MKKTKVIVLVSTVFLFSSKAFAISVTGNATATIKAAITATETQQMAFGTISSTTTAGTVTLSPAGARSSTLAYYGTSQPGVFSITAEPSTAITVSFTNGTLISGGHNMTVSNFASSSSPASNITDTGGALTLNVGGDLAVGANQASGSYAGTYNFTLSY